MLADQQRPLSPQAPWRKFSRFTALPEIVSDFDGPASAEADNRIINLASQLETPFLKLAESVPAPM